MGFIPLVLFSFEITFQIFLKSTLETLQHLILVPYRSLVKISLSYEQLNASFDINYLTKWVLSALCRKCNLGQLGNYLLNCSEVL